MTRRSDLPGAKLHLTFANGKTDYVLVVAPPLMSAFARPRSSNEGEEALSLERTHRAAVYAHQVHNSVTARAGLLLQNAGAVTAEDVKIEISVPARLQLSFVEQEPPPKTARKTPVVPLEPSPRSWRSDSETRAHCRVVRVTSSVGLPLLFLTLQDPKDSGSFELELKITAARPELEQTSRLTVQFVQPEGAAAP
ncbi:MAG TPA: hypothetical protein VHW01_21160 [Polyangiaceae bacterium]|nr:hypothetical protein [Polyangiaceae bacterium]